MDGSQSGMIDTMSGFDELVAGMSTETAAPEDSAAQTDPITDPAPTQTTQETNPAPEGTATPAATATAPAATKQAAAFAQMRIQQKMYEQALTKILDKAGIDPTLAKNPAELQKFLEQADTQEQAEEMKVPPELLTRLRQLEQKDQQYEQERLQKAAVDGLVQLQTKYKLDKQGVMSFIQQLQESGINPFAREVDFEREYKLLNFEKILEAEKEAAVQAALSKQKAAQTHSTQPSATTSKPDTVQPGGDKIDTMAGFDRLLKQII